MEEIGFFVIVNHDVPQASIARTFAEARRFHDQPPRKMALRMNEYTDAVDGLARRFLPVCTVALGNWPEEPGLGATQDTGADDDELALHR